MLNRDAIIDIIFDLLPRNATLYDRFIAADNVLKGLVLAGFIDIDLLDIDPDFAAGTDPAEPGADRPGVSAVSHRVRDTPDTRVHRVRPYKGADTGHAPRDGHTRRDTVQP